MINFNPYKKPVFILVLFTVPLFVISQWIDVGNSAENIHGLGEFQKAIEINPFNGHPVVAYCDWATSKVMVKEYDGANWNDVGNSNSALNGEGEVGFDLAISPVNGHLFIYFKSSATDSSKVMEFDGFAWNDLGNISRYIHVDPEITVNPISGEPFVIKKRNLGRPKNVVQYSGGVWITVGPQDDWNTTKAGSIVDLKFNPITNEPYIVFGSKVMKFDGTNWEEVGYSVGHTISEMDFHPETNEPYVISADNSGTSLKKYIGKMEWQDIDNGNIDIKSSWNNNVEFLFNPYNNDILIAGEWNDSLIVHNFSQDKIVGNSETVIDSMLIEYFNFKRSPLNNHLFMVYADANSDKLMVKEYVCSTTSEITIDACDSYTSPSGNYTWTSSGTYLDTIPNTEGCDSIITINLTIHHDTLIPMAAESCESYTSPSGKYTYTSTGIYHDTLVNHYGCDSILELDVTILEQSTSAFTEVVCDSMVSPSGKYTWKTSGTYNDTLVNYWGCDSIITYNLTVNYTTYANISIAACETYTSPSGNYTWTSSGRYNDTILNSTGCDSIISIELLISNAATTNDTVVYAVCDNLFKSVNPVVHFDSTYVYSSIYGCDSTVYKYQKFVYSESVFTDTVSIMDTNIIYKEVTDTVSVYDTVLISIVDSSTLNAPFMDDVIAINIFPNPANVYINVQSEHIIDKVDIIDGTGALQKTVSVNNTQKAINLEGMTSGHYILVIHSNGQMVKRKIVLIE